MFIEIDIQKSMGCKNLFSNEVTATGLEPRTT